jgi:hypothetical protein
VRVPAFAVSRNIVITSHHEFQFGIEAAKQLQRFLVHRQAADLGLNHRSVRVRPPEELVTKSDATCYRRNQGCVYPR